MTTACAHPFVYASARLRRRSGAQHNSPRRGLLRRPCATASGDQMKSCPDTQQRRRRAAAGAVLAVAALLAVPEVVHAAQQSGFAVGGAAGSSGDGGMGGDDFYVYTTRDLAGEDSLSLYVVHSVLHSDSSPLGHAAQSTLHPRWWPTK